MMDRENQSGHPTGRPYKTCPKIGLKSDKICTAVEIYLHCGATIGALWMKFISTAVRFLTCFRRIFRLVKTPPRKGEVARSDGGVTNLKARQ